MTAAISWVCSGCGAMAAPNEAGAFPFQCPNAAAARDVDHVLTRVLDPSAVAWPVEDTLNPFVKYRRLLYSWHAARERGWTDEQYVAAVGAFDAAVARLDGAGFRATPFARQPALSAAAEFDDAGGIWVKDETGNVSGSHKARHLAGIMLLLSTAGSTAGRESSSRELAIASCGNAALAAAVVARAAGMPLRTFVPPDADARVLARLRSLGAAIAVCPRRPGEAGDPCYKRFKEALAAGALPFCCQGPDNGLTIEGGETLAYEIADSPEGHTLDAIVIQVGGGALASACIQGLRDAVALGRLPRLPRIFTVQTRGAAPLARAFDRVTALAATAGAAHALRYAASHRAEFMWPWETPPQSIAHGILDDETYDWMAVVRGMLETGGRTIVVDDDAVRAANALARETTAIDVDHTGSAGLAGLRALREAGILRPQDRVAVIFSGVRRG